MNHSLSELHPYPFAKLRKLFEGIVPNPKLKPLRLSIGEPEHALPKFVEQVLLENCASLRKYPPTAGSPELKRAISNWATARFGLESTVLDSESMVLPCNGTREALFAIVQTIVDHSVSSRPLVMMPNPFYQIYEGATILAGAEPKFINNNPVTQQPDFDSISEDDWARCQILFICTPGNPSGVSLKLSQLKKLIQLADQYNFVIASDECYSELYLDEDSPVPGLLQACEAMNRADFKRCLVFHSLSKRSNLAGLRSGFVAGDPDLISKFLLYRTYHGSAMSLHSQAISTAVWSDEEHVIENRAIYREKYDALCPMLADKFEYQMPDAGFYLWLRTPESDINFASKLYEKQHLTVLPGSFLSRSAQGVNPGFGYIRLALVSPLTDCRAGIERLLEQAD